MPDTDYFGPVKKPDPNHFRFCNSSEPEWVDPALATSTADTPLARLMFAGLADFGADVWGSAVPSIAHRWESAGDLRTFTFHLRDDVFWSNGRKLTSADFVYHASRILHPSTTSRNTEPLRTIKNAELYTQGRVKVLLRDVPPFKEGEVVEVAESEMPPTNLRQASKELKLRDLRAEVKDAYAAVPPRSDVEIIELSADQTWAYVFYQGPMFKWFYGWVPRSELDIEPNALVSYAILERPPEEQVGASFPPDPDFRARGAIATGADLLSLPEVLGLRAPDPLTFIVETRAPIPFVLDDINKRVYRPTPRESVSRAPLTWTQPGLGHLVTSGPFTMTEWRGRDYTRFKKSETYFDRARVTLNTITSYNIDDQAASANLYFTGECDATTANHVPSSYIPMLQGQRRGGRAYKDFDIQTYDGSYFYVINVEKITSRHLRRALNLAVDRSAIPAITKGGEIPSSSFVPGMPISSLSEEERELCEVEADAKGLARIVTKGELCYRPPLGLEFDPELAKKELAMAREELGDAFPKQIEAMYNIGTEAHKLIAEFLQQQWAENLGLHIPLATMEWKTYLEQTSQGNFQVARMGWIGGSPNPEADFHGVFNCGSPYNRSRYCSKEYSRLYSLAQNTVDKTQRLRLLERAEKVLLEDAALIPIMVYTQKLLKRPYVQDYYVNMGGNPPLHLVKLNPNWNQEANSAP